MSEFLSQQTKPRYAIHVEWLINNLGAKLEKALARENVDISLTDAMNVFLSADPSEAKRAVDWLVKTYLAQGFLWEDIEAGNTSKVAETLVHFATYRSRLVGSARNLHEYGKLAEVWQAIKEFVTKSNVNDTSNRAAKRLEKEQVLSETTVLFRDESMIVAIPLTKRSSIWWGKGTRWCTAANNNNYFQNYNLDAPLIIFTFPQGLPSDILTGVSKIRKLQLWFTLIDNDFDQCNYAFMDEDDNEVTPEFIQDNWQIFQPILEWAQKANPQIIRLFPTHAINQEMCDRALANNPEYLFSAPEEYLNKENCWSALEKDSSVISCVPKEFLDKEICDFVLSKNASCIGYFKSEWIENRHLIEYAATVHLSVVPDVFKERITNDIITQAIKQRYQCFQYIPREYIDSEVCKVYIEQGGSLGYIPDDLLNSDICLIAVSKDEENLYKVPKNLWNQEILGIATKSKHWMAVPEALRTIDFHSEVIMNCDNDQQLLFRLPKEIFSRLDKKTFDHCLSTFANSVLLLPKKKMDLNSYIKASQCFGFSLEWIPKKFRAQVFNNMPDSSIGFSSLKSLSLDERTQEVCARAVQADSFNILSVPHKFLNFEILSSAIRKTCVLIEEKKLKEFLTPDLALLAFSQGYYWLGRINEQLKTREVCLASLKNMDVNITYVPIELLTDSFCKEAYAIAPGIIRFLKNPEDIKEIVLERYWQDKTTINRIPEQWITQDIIMDLKQCLINDQIHASQIPPYLLSNEFVTSVENGLVDIEGERSSEPISLEKQDCVWSDQILDELKQILSNAYTKGHAYK